MMGWFEIANLVCSAGFSALMTIWAQKSKDKKDEREFLLKRATENREAIKEARDAKGGYEINASQNKKSSRVIKVFGRTIWDSDFKLLDKGTAVRSTGYHFTRRFIAILAVMCVIFLPKVIPIINSDITVIIGYYETITSWLPWIGDREAVKWVAFGSGNTPIMISPMELNIIYTIVALFFGNQITKR